MIINDKDAAARLNSPMNLINRLRTSTSERKNAMNLFIPRSAASESSETPASNSSLTKREEEPEIRLNDLIENHDSKIQLGLAHDGALRLLNNSIKALEIKLEDVKADKLPSVIAAASKTVESIRRERNEAAKNDKDQEVHFHFYTPEQRKVADFEVIEVS
jgi:hypothetical protein